MVRPRGFEPLTHWLKASCSTCWAKGAMVPFIGLEPTTYWLQVSCSANWAKTAWWKLRDSNPWPLPCKGNALPTELNFLKMVTYTGLEPVNPWMKTMCVDRFTNRPNGADNKDWTCDPLVNSQLLYRWAMSAIQDK